MQRGIARPAWIIASAAVALAVVASIDALLCARLATRPGDLWEEKLDLLRRCLDELPEQQRTVIQSYYWEDLDWCYRMRRTGWGVYHVPEACAIHAARREGVRRPLGRAQRAQLFGAIKFFREFGWNAGKVAS